MKVAKEYFWQQLHVAWIRSSFEIDNIYKYYNHMVMIDTRLLQAFIVIAQERSVTRAAHRLHITQPAMSATLRKLRVVFDDPLFVRAGNGLTTTERAEEALIKVRQIVGLMDDLEREVSSFDPVQDDVTFRIEASDFTHSVILPTAVKMLADEAPGIRLSIQPLSGDLLVQSLENGDLDFAILPEFLAPANLQMRKLFEEDFVCLMRKGHPDDKVPFTREMFSRCSHVRVLPNLSQRMSRIDRLFREWGQRRDIRLTVSSYNTVPGIVAVTDHVALFPRGMASRLSADFAVHPLPLPLKPIAMCLVWHPKKQTARSHQWARDFLARAAKGAYVG